MKASGETSVAHPPEAVAGPLAVVDPEPGVRERTQLGDGFKEVRVQHLGRLLRLKRSMYAF